MSRRSEVFGRVGWLALVALGSISAVSARPFVDGPLPGTTGGFGEPSCDQCHFDITEPDPEGRLTVDGWPAAYAPGQRYPLTIRLLRPEMRRGGFQLAVRHTDARQAGGLSATDERVAVVLFEGIGYASQTRRGSELSAPGAAVWRLDWEAPSRSRQPVRLHAAGNAANGDDSQFGDHIYVYTDSSSAVGSDSGPRCVVAPH